ncbi:hypothetical protein SLEP1_g46213 [Rubroshorea leprosula]|uniref:Uncharacterized protein n=1 Tax=Rubroshorea leprosula TaxID=152421 RepID=A0AAV5LLI2_9ROSI|nr:hypothetical protein SLEP1_g46213 [Rubroshorea leprosula]
MLPSAASIQLAKSYNPKDSGRLQSYHKGRFCDYYELMDTSWLARGMESRILFIKARDCAPQQRQHWKVSMRCPCHTKGAEGHRVDGTEEMLPRFG